MKLRPLLAASLAAAAPAAAPAAAAPCQLCAQDSAQGVAARRVSDAVPLHVEVDTQLDFSRVAVGAAGGTVEVDPASGARRLGGDIVDLGGFAVSGVVSVRGAPGAELRVFLPATVELAGTGGRTARVTGLATDLPAAPRLGPDGRLRFRFGGRLQVDAQGDGDYRGRIPVTVEYQ